jgi:hypothetical protein
MYDDLWYMNIESQVFDTIKKKSTPYLLEKYPDINFTSSAVTERPPSFPCVEITELQGMERGQTLENDVVPAYMATFQVNVYSEAQQGKAVARDVMGEIVVHFKKDLRFNITGMPVYTNFNGIHRYSARFRRMIGSCDTI